MSDLMKPALTPEEWGRSVRLLSDGTAEVLCDFGTGVGVHFVENSVKHRLAALALHGQPFGFADEDRAMLYLFADTLGARGVHVSHVARCRSLADRIAALLPPEGP